MLNRWRPLVALLLLFAMAACARPHESWREPDLPPLLRRADAAFQRRDYPEAARLYGYFLQYDPPDELVPQAMYRLAQAHFRQQQYEPARAVLDDLRDRYPEQSWAQVMALYGDIEEQEGREVTALLWWDRAWKLAAEGERRELTSRITTAVAAMPAEERRQARAVITSAEVQRALDEAPPPPRHRSTPAAVEPQATPPLPSLALSARARVGVLLPLSGPYQNVGEHSLQGIRLAFAEHEDQLEVRDTAGDSAAGVKALDDLLADPAVVAVIGPLRSAVAAAVAPRAESAALPLLLLSQREGLSGNFVLQTGMTRTLQADTLVSYVVRRLGLTHLGVFYPRDSYGKDFATAFRDAAQRAGAQIVGLESYDPRQPDTGVLIAQAKAWDGAARLDALFVPDSADAVARIGPYLREQLPHVVLLGTSSWNEPGVLAGVANALDGAVFVDGFFMQSSRPATRIFSDRSLARYGTPADILGAQAFDAASLVSSVLARGAHTRADVQRSLRDFGLYRGASGDIQLSRGEVHRGLFLLRLHQGAVEEIGASAAPSVEMRPGAAVF